MTDQEKTIHVQIVGVLRKPDGEARHALEVPVGATVTDVMVRMGYTPQEAGRVGALRGGKALSRAATPDDGDELTLYLPVGGG